MKKKRLLSLITAAVVFSTTVLNSGIVTFGSDSYGSSDSISVESESNASELIEAEENVSDDQLDSSTEAYSEEEDIQSTEEQEEAVITADLNGETSALEPGSLIDENTPITADTATESDAVDYIEAESETAQTAGTEGEALLEAPSDQQPASDEQQHSFLEPYGNLEDLSDMDFTSLRLLIRTNDPEILTWDTHVLSSYGNLYLASFGNEEETRNAYTYYKMKAELVETDTFLYAADNQTDEAREYATLDPFKALNGLIKYEQSRDGTGTGNLVALIDTGANEENAIELTSVVDNDPHDHNGHGTMNAAIIQKGCGEKRIVSVKALNDTGIGTISSVYAAMEYATVRGDVSLICLPLSAPLPHGSALLQEAVDHAVSSGITVVGAAGNAGIDVKDTVPGNLNDVITVGACTEEGEKSQASNYGTFIDYYAVAESTSQAAALVSGYLAGETTLSDLTEKEDVYDSLLSQKTEAVPPEEEIAEEQEFTDEKEPDQENIIQDISEPVVSDQTDEIIVEETDEQHEKDDETDPSVVTDTEPEETEIQEDQAEETDADEIIIDSSDPDVIPTQEGVEETPKETVPAKDTEEKQIKEAEEKPDDQILSQEEIAETSTFVAPDDLRSVKQLRKNGLLRQSTQEDFTFDDYWIEGNDAVSDNHIHKTDDFTMKYQMEIHFSRDVEASKCTIRVPKCVITDRYGRQIPPSSIPVPEGTEGSHTPSNVTPFNYYEDGEDLVFWNYKNIVSGTNCSIQVLYSRIDALSITDGTTWEVDPVAEVEFAESLDENDQPIYLKQTKEGPVLTGDIDTAVQLEMAAKTAETIAGKSYTPELYTYSQIADAVTPSYLVNIPDNLEDYVFIRWKIQANGYGNQPYALYLKDTPGTGDTPGTLVGFSTPCTEITEGEYEGYYLLDDQDKRRNYSSTISVVTMYPKDSLTEPLRKVENTVEVVCHPKDGIDADTSLERTATWSYRDYKWNYRGDTIGIVKVNTDQNQDPYKDYVYSGWMNIYKDILDKDKGEDLESANFKTTGILRAFNVTHYTTKDEQGIYHIGDYRPGAFVKTMTTDDFVYAYPEDGDHEGAVYVLSPDDYYFNGVAIDLTEYSYDVYEDKQLNSIESREINKDCEVYAMFDGSDEWEHVATIPFSLSGKYYYTFTPEDLARKPYRVKTEFNSTEYYVESKISAGVTIKHDSPVFNELANTNTTSVRLENISGISGWYVTDEYPDGRWIQDTSTDVNYLEEGLAEATEELYGTILMRDSAYGTLRSVDKTARASKGVKATSDLVNGRVNVLYTIRAFESYDTYSSRIAELLTETGVDSPDRSAVEIYDLLPYGVTFNPNTPIKGGLLQNPSVVSGWNSASVSVGFNPETDIIENWNNTGRTMLVFHLRYDGEKTAIIKGSSWFTGYGLSFGGYVKWNDLKLVKNDQNIAAYMPAVGDTKPLIGKDSEVSCDDGDPVNTDDREEYLKFGSDINGDGITDIRNVLYAKAYSVGDFAITASSGITKLVKADSDLFGEYTDNTAVTYSEGYSYQITVKNTSRYKLKNIIVFDRLENAALDRREAEPFYGFEDDGWHGTFAGIDRGALRQAGVSATFYYNTNRDALIPAGSEDPYAVLTPENGWIAEGDFNGSLDDVKAIAADLSYLENGEAYKLGNNEGISFKVKMRAPDNEQSFLYAYNNPAFYSVTEGLTTEEDTAETVIGNSVKVRLSDQKNFEVEKELTGEVPSNVKRTAFLFTLKRTTSGSILPNRLYRLYQKNDQDEFVEIEKDELHATDASGQFTLNAGQKAVFLGLTDADNITAEEVINPYWDPNEQITDTDTTRTELVENTYRPVVYVEKKTKYAPDTAEINDQEFRFRVYENNQPMANEEIWVVQSIPGSIYTAPVKLETRTTDENGYFRLKTGEKIAIRLHRIGDSYRVEEAEDTYGSGTDWICEQPFFEGTTNSTRISSGTIENLYKWKDLYLTKHLINQDETTCEEPFTFKVWKVNDPSDTDITVDNLTSKATLLTNTSWHFESETETHEIGATGEITAACAGKTIVINGLEAGKDYIVQEIVTNALYVPDNELIRARAPLYGTNVKKNIVNTYQLCDLTVGKMVVGKTRYDEIGTAYSRTLNVSETGEMLSNYPTDCNNSYIRGTGRTNGSNNAHVVTIPGAGKLEVTITYGGYNYYYDYVCMWEGSHSNYTAASNYSSSLTGKLGGGDYTTESHTKKYVVSGDTVTFAFRSYYYSSTTSPRYGYYAVIKGYEDVPEGSFSVLVERRNADTGNYEPAAGASGISTYTGELITSDENGYITLRDGESVTFDDFGEIGTDYRISEIPDARYRPLYPKEGEYAEGKLAVNGNSVVVMNGSPDSLFLQKNYIGSDETTKKIADVINSYTIQDKAHLLETYSSTYSRDYPLAFNSLAYLEVHDGTGWKRISPSDEEYSFSYVDPDGNIIDYKTINASALTTDYGVFVIPVGTIIRVSKNNGSMSDYQYRLVETAVVASYDKNSKAISNQLAGSAEDPGRKEFYVRINDSSSNPNNMLIHVNNAHSDVEATGTVSENNLAVLENTLETTEMKPSWTKLSKNVTNGYQTQVRESIPDGAVLVFRVEKWDGSNWVPAKGIPYMRDTDVFTESLGSRYVQEYENIRFTQADGLIRIAAPSYSISLQNGIYFYTNATGSTPIGQLRVVEVPELSDREWGAFYTNSSVQLDNIVGTKKIRVEKNTEEETDKDFTFKVDFTTTDQMKKIGPVFYDVFDSDTGEFIETRTLSVDQTLTIKSGQYAEISLPPLHNGRFLVNEINPYPWELESAEVSDPIRSSVEADQTAVFNLSENYIYRDFASTRIPSDIRTKVSHLYFGSKQQYANEISGIDGINVDNQNLGEIKAYPVPNGDGTISLYVCSETEDVVKCGSLGVTISPLQDSLVYADVRGLDTHNSENFSSFAAGCTHLEEVKGIDDLDYSDAITLSNMFAGCNSLKLTDFHDIQLPRATTMANMFNACYALEHLNMDNLYAPKLQNTTSMFLSCNGLKTLSMNNLHTESYLTTTNMANGLTSLESVEFKNAYLPQCGSMSQMFAGCTSLKSVDMSNLYAPTCTQIDGILVNASALENWNLSHADLSSIPSWGSSPPSAASMGTGTEEGTSVDISYAKLGSLDYFMYAGTKTKEVDFTGAALVGSDTSISNMFVSGDVGELIGLEQLDLSKVERFENCFISLNNKKLDISGLHLDNCTHFINNIVGCSQLEELDMHGFYAPKLGDVVTNGFTILSGSNNIKKLDISESDFGTYRSDISTLNLANSKPNLEYIDAHDTKMSAANGLFYNFKNGTVDVTNFNPGIRTSEMFKKNENVEIIGLRTMDYSAVEETYGMFSEAKINGDIDLTGISFPSLHSMMNMFYSTQADNIILKGASSTSDYSYGYSMTSMFQNAKTGLIDMSDTSFPNSSSLNSTFYKTQAEKVDMSNSDFSQTVSGFSMNSCFYGAVIDEIDLSGMDLSTYQNNGSLFDSTGVINKVDASNMKIGSISYLFNSCSAHELNVTNLEMTTAGNGSITNSFANMGNITDESFIGLKTIDVSRATGSMTSNFANDVLLETLDLSGMDFGNITYVNEYSGSGNLKNLILADVDMHNVTDFTWNLSGTSSVEKVDLSGADLRKAQVRCSRFAGSGTQLKEIDVSDAIVRTYYYMFYNTNTEKLVVTNLKHADSGSSFNSANYMFGSATLGEVIGMDTLDMTGIIDMSNMFYNTKPFSSGQVLDISGWDVSDVTNVKYMFYNSGTNGHSTLIMKDLHFDSLVNGSNIISDYANADSQALETVDLRGTTFNSNTNLNNFIYSTGGLQTIYCNDDWLDTISIDAANDINTKVFSGINNGTPSLVGAIPYDSTKVSAAYANPDTGYFTRSAA